MALVGYLEDGKLLLTISLPKRLRPGVVLTEPRFGLAASCAIYSADVSEELDHVHVAMVQFRTHMAGGLQATALVMDICEVVSCHFFKEIMETNLAFGVFSTSVSQELRAQADVATSSFAITWFCGALLERFSCHQSTRKRVFAVPAILTSTTVSQHYDMAAVAIR